MTFHGPVKARRCKLCLSNEVALLYEIGGPEPYDLLECRSCGFHFIGYLDEPAAPSPFDVDRVAATVVSGLESNAARNAANVAMLVGLVPSGAVLDVGSGGGAFLSSLGSHYHCVGVEVDPRFVALSRARGLDVRTEPLESPAWDMEAGRFDAVTLWDVIEHVNDPAATVARAYALLRPDGVLLMDTPSRDGFLYRFGEWTAWATGGRRPTTMGVQYSPTPFCHKQIFRKVDMRRLLASFAEVEIREKFELSFPAEHYLRAIMGNERLARFLAPLADTAVRALPIRNKLIVAAVKHSQRPQ